MARTRHGADRPLPIGRSYTAAFSPDGTTLAVVGQNVTLWDVAARVKRWRVHPVKHPSHCVFSGDGSRLTVKTTSGRIVTVDAATGGGDAPLTEADEGEGCRPVYSPCSRWLVDGSWGGTLTVRDAATGSVAFRRAVAGEGVHDVLRSRDGSVWISNHTVRSTAGWATRIMRWSWPFGTPTTHGLPMQNVEAVALSDGGRRLAVAHGAGPATSSVTVLDATTFGPVGETITAPGYVKTITWSPGGDELAVVVDGGHLVYAWPGLAHVATHGSQYAADIVYAPDGTRVTLCDWSKGLVATPAWLRSIGAGTGAASPSVG